MKTLVVAVELTLCTCEVRASGYGGRVVLVNTGRLFLRLLSQCPSLRCDGALALHTLYHWLHPRSPRDSLVTVDGIMAPARKMGRGAYGRGGVQWTDRTRGGGGAEAGAVEA